jgi:uncharacterized oxidoreductase
MQTSNNTILITGGATGIGLALAVEFLDKGNEVIICGRRENALNEAKSKYPKLHIHQSDISKIEERKSLASWTIQNFPKLNMLVNNAGIQREFLMDDINVADKFATENEIEINLTAPIHLTMLLLPHLKQQENSAIINISSGLAYVPISIMPVYCATKSALQSFTKSLRYQLHNDNIKVFEVSPPVVDTELDKGARDQRGQTNKGLKPEVVATETLKGLSNDNYNISVGQVKILRIVSRIIPTKIFKILNGKVKR